ncbi:MAG: hypothetical protein AB7F74_22905, partial [Parvibaculaceae bacterium]
MISVKASTFALSVPQQTRRVGLLSCTAVAALLLGGAAGVVPVLAADQTGAAAAPATSTPGVDFNPSAVIVTGNTVVPAIVGAGTNGSGNATNGNPGVGQPPVTNGTNGTAG